MNQQILKLASSCFPRDGDGNIHATPEIIAEFAELIVRKCIGILNTPDYVMEKKVKLSRYNQGWVNGRLLGIEHIKEHFGVEE